VRQVIDAHDEERRRIAQELHDGLGQNLMLLANRQRRAAAAFPETKALRDLADESFAELRNISRNLHPHQLDRLGLEAALESMLDQTLGDAGIEYASEISCAEVPTPAALQVYRIAQEAVSNIVRHAAASTVRFRLACTRASIELDIRDDGKGMPAGPRRAGRSTTPEASGRSIR
jgi:signal transduction histidine kinase